MIAVEFRNIAVDQYKEIERIKQEKTLL